MRLKTIIVEDEPLSRVFLTNLLAQFCPDIEVVATVAHEDEAVQMIEKTNPDLVFMDIELQQGTGFNVLKRTHHHQYRVIFTTAFDHHGIKAIKFSGVDYLQKPIDIEGLQSVITFITENRKMEDCCLAVKHLLHTLDNNEIPEQLMVITASGARYIPIAEIIFIEGEGELCSFKTAGEKISTQSNEFKAYEQLLKEYNFSEFITLSLLISQKIKEYDTAETGIITMTDNSKVPVSMKKTKELVNLIRASS